MARVEEIARRFSLAGVLDDDARARERYPISEIEVADIAIVPVEPSQRGLRAMKRTIQLITSVSPDLKIGLIVNRYSDKRVIDRSFTDFLAADDLPILAACRLPRRSSAARRSTSRYPRCSRAAAPRTRSRGFWTRWRRCCNGTDEEGDSVINSFFTDTSKEMIDRQETIVEKVVNPAPEPEAGERRPRPVAPPERDRPRRPLLAAQEVPGGAPRRGLPQRERSHALAARGPFAQGPLGGPCGIE